MNYRVWQDANGWWRAEYRDPDAGKWVPLGYTQPKAFPKDCYGTRRQARKFCRRHRDRAAHIPRMEYFELP
jgi:hypothetical protein